MIDIDKLIEIASFIEASDILSELQLLKERINSENQEVVIPLVGEFSSGKTSLINSLIDSASLETASESTTSTIYEVRFGSESCYAEITNNNGDVAVIESIDLLKNASLSSTSIVRLFDTSKRVPQSIVLVDTPGLSSNVASHRIALTSYLPSADAVFLVVDINQGVTKSLAEFVSSFKINKSNLFLIISQCDTKPQDKVEQFRETLISSNLGINSDNILCVSAKKHQLDELYSILDKIQQARNKIVTSAINNRLGEIASKLSQNISTILKATREDKSFDELLFEQDSRLDDINGNINKLIKESKKRIDDLSSILLDEFRNSITPKLDTIIREQENCDQRAYNAIVSTANLSLNHFKKQVQSKMVELAKRFSANGVELPMQTLQFLDLSSIVFNDATFSYNLGLESLGHQNDQIIGTGVKVLLAAAAVVAVVATAGTAAAGVAAGEAGGAAAAGGAVVGEAAAGTVGSGAAGTAVAIASGADTATDIASMISNKKTRERIAKMAITAKEAKNQFLQNMDDINEFDEEAGQKMGAKKGLIGSGVNFVTDRFEGRPQRMRAINSYLSNTLLPQIEETMCNFKNEIVDNIESSLYQEASDMIIEIKKKIAEIEEEKKSNSEAYIKRINILKEYLSIL